MSGWRSDVVMAMRGLRANPGYTITAILTLALGIGATCAVFSLTNWLLLRPLPGVARPNELVTVTFGSDEATLGLSYPSFTRIRKAVSGLQDVMGFFKTQLNVAPAGMNEPHRLTGELVSGNYFSVLGGAITTGRDFTTAEASDPAADPVVIVSTRFCREILGGVGNPIGRDVFVTGERFTIVGVAPEGFRGVQRAGATDVWLPVPQYRRAMPQYPATWLSAPRQGVFFALIGRRAPGVGTPVVTSQMQAVLESQRAADPGDRRLQRFHYMVNDGADANRYATLQLRPSMGLLMGVVSLLFVLTCANVANLVLGRATGRRLEVATRLALGASRLRVARLLFVESSMLTATAAAIAVGVAWLSGEALRGTIVLQGLPPLQRAELDWRVVTFASLAAMVAALLAGTLPAFWTSRLDLQSALRTSGRTLSASRGRLRQGLVTMQVAASLTMVIGALLLVRSMWARYAIDPGFNPHGVLAFSIEPKLPGYEGPQYVAFYKQVLERVRALPGARAAGLAWAQPYSPIANDAIFANPEHPERTVDAEFNSVTDGFITALGLRLTAGRDFTPAEVFAPAADGSPVIINASAARRLFGDEPPIGRRVVLTGGKDNARTIVGVVDDLRQRRFMAQPEPVIFSPMTSSYQNWATVVVGLNGSASSVATAARQVVASVDPRVPVYDVTTLDEAIRRQLSDMILVTRLTLIFAVIATAVAALGLYGVLARSVVERRRELSIRSALGAAPRAIVRLIGRDAVIVTTIGLVVGAGLTAWLSKFLVAYLYGVERLDPAASIAAVVLVFATAMIATLPPARSASRIDAASELR